MKIKTIFYLALVFMVLIAGCRTSTKTSTTIKDNSKSDTKLQKEVGEPQDLFEVAYSGDVNQARLLIQKGADVNAKDENGLTPLQLLLESSPDEEDKEYHEMVKLFIACGADVNVKDMMDGRTPLHCVAGGVYEDLVELFLEKAADVNAKDTFQQTPLHEAATFYKRDIIELLLAAGADINAKDDVGRTALHNVVHGEFFDGNFEEIKDLVKLLVTNGADVDATDEDGQTPLTLAVDGYDKEIAQLLIGKSTNVNIQLAAFVGDMEKVQDFINSGTDINDCDDKDRTALHTAASGGNLDVVRLLLKCGADVNARNENGMTALYYAADIGYMEIAVLLIREGANVNARTKNGDTPLHEAASNGYTGIVQLLITKGADVNTKNEYGKTALHEVTWSESWNDMIDFWGGPDEVDMPADIFYINRYINTAAVLIENDADVNIKDQDERTPLHLAAAFTHTSFFDLGSPRRPGANEEGHNVLAGLLIDAGADIHAKDSDGMTALHIAARDGYKGVVRLLLDNGATVNAIDNEGKTPLDYANDGNWKEITEILKAAGGNEGN